MDPFHIEGPAVISFSGGRTSGLMLRRVLDAHGGTLPANVHVVFANTGLEREETLRFVDDCACEHAEHGADEAGDRAEKDGADGSAHAEVRQDDQEGCRGKTRGDAQRQQEEIHAHLRKRPNNARWVEVWLSERCV
jgi:3'-phosphoadenosine 5'-phosphosulfate sulfotransferase (PAPS reductase)/FAD synthetase